METLEKLKCELCSVPLEPIEFNGVVFRPRYCDPCIEVLRAKDEANEKVARARRLMLELEELVGKNPSIYSNFETFTTNMANVEAVKYLKGWNPKEDYSVYLHGPCGAGKTHLAVSAFRQYFCGIGKFPNYTGHSEFMRLFRKLDAAEERHRIQWYGGLQLWVLDDLGAGKFTEFANDILIQVMTERERRGTPGMIITSNLSLNDLAVRMNDDRLASRINGMFKVFEIKDADHRGKGKK